MSGVIWTEEYVWQKIESVVPYARLSGMVMPKALEKAAVELFLMGEGEHNGSWRAYVVEECLKALKAKGFLEFGDVEQDWGYRVDNSNETKKEKQSVR